MVTYRRDDAHALPQNYTAALDLFGRLVRQVDPGQWGLPTPCRRWTVRDLVHHVTVQHLWVPPLLAGVPAAVVDDRVDGDRHAEDPVLAWKRASAEAEEAVHTKGALDRPVTLWTGPAPATHLCSQLAMDTVVHAWDLARAIGADTRLPDPLVSFALRELSGYADRLAASGLFDRPRPVPAHADSQTRLLALTGRDGQTGVVTSS
ncbi:TIGR03086 family metal-binding protein [Streptacidiphilus jiangxiensis]|uniref:TIGR03086 family protein n=1 Tax=Streptacidiphilus jiangxiensis TaxID=235985 RepID=A0A1H7V528_STRJI|nr:TIGR03086 family metal-binding protein [Streptacidiphilus jiangxiensis]SEM03807.1 TIGR03086 family protein [Streptacidiphilus jiangxiensis]